MKVTLVFSYSTQMKLKRAAGSICACIPMSPTQSVAHDKTVWKQKMKHSEIFIFDTHFVSFIVQVKLLFCIFLNFSDNSFFIYFTKVSVCNGCKFFLKFVLW